MSEPNTTMASQPLRHYLTIKQAHRKYNGIWETEGALRNTIHKAADRHSSIGVIKGNGLGNAILRIGRKVVLDEEKLVEWIQSHQTGGQDNG